MSAFIKIKKRFHKFIIFCLLLVLYSCAGSVEVSSIGIKKDINTIKEKITKDRKKIISLEDKKIGSSGFYYVIDRDGRVVFHPKKFLIGNNFKKYSFVEQILEKNSGCLRYKLGSIEYVVFYEPLNDEEILCLSIQSKELIGKIENCIELKEISGE